MAYDEAARIMCGSRARTNFSSNSVEVQSSSRRLLSATLMAKLQRCQMTSLSMSKKPTFNEQNRAVEAMIFDTTKKDDDGKKGGNENGYGSIERSLENVQELKCLEDDDIEQMIQELLDYGSLELCSVMDNST